MSLRRLQRFQQPLAVDGVDLSISALRRAGTEAPIVFLHGFGSTKEDYADIIQHPELDDHAVLAYDAPPCGRSATTDLSASTIPFFIDTAERMLDAAAIDRFHLVGHSMGGLTGLLLADRHPQSVLSFTDIEGNLTPEDCFLSRQIVTHPSADPATFLAEFRDRAADSRFAASALYSASLPYKVRADAVPAIFTSMVDLSDHGALLERFLALPMPRMFMYGEQNNNLTYLPTLDQHGVELAEITDCGHFPMYSNQPQMWIHIARFITGSAGEDRSV